MNASAATRSSEDAEDLMVFACAGPVATVALPQRIPLGFHSYWCPGA